MITEGGGGGIGSQFLVKNLVWNLWREKIFENPRLENWSEKL